MSLLRHPHPSTGIRWAGPGRTAFAAPVAVGATGVPRTCAGRQHIAECLGPGADSPRAQALADFFAIGGKECARECIILCDERLYDPSWIGEDAGPGSRSGVHALAELDDVGTVVLLAPDPTPGLARREKAVVDLAQKRRDVLFLLESDGGGASSRLEWPIFLLQPNVAVIDARRTSVAAIAGYLEASDWQESPSYWPRRPAPPAGVKAGDCAELVAWRRRAGLRRSMDLGTRWMLFEPSHPLLWRTVERDVSAFLYRLERLGFFADEARGAEDYRVECAPFQDSESGALDASRLRLTVDAAGRAELDQRTR